MTSTRRTLLHHEVAGTLSVIIATIAAGLNIYLAKVLSFISGLLLASITLTSAGLILTLVNAFLRNLDEMLNCIRKHPLKILWIGIIGTAIPINMIFYGLHLSPISNTFLLQMEVIYSIFLSRMLLGERISLQQALLSILAFFGVFLITSEGTLRGISTGDLLFLLAPFFFQCGHVIAKNLMRVINPITVVTYRLLTSGLSSLLISTLIGLNPLGGVGNMTLRDTVTIFCLSLSYAIGNSFWYYGIKNLNLSKATAIIITYPIIPVVLAIITLEEKLTIIKSIGIIMVFFSVIELSLLRSTDGRNS